MSPTLRTLPVLALLAACGPMAGGSVPPADADPGIAMPAPVLPRPEDDTCGASSLASYIGQDASMIDAARFQNPVRVIRPGEAVTMDYSPQRLNFELDALDEIERIRCG